MNTTQTKDIQRIIQCESLDIAAFIESTEQQGHNCYFPQNILFFIEQGTLHIDTNGKSHTYPAGSFILLRKFTTGIIYKTWTQEEGLAKTYLFIFHDEFIHKAIRELNLPVIRKAIHQQCFHFQKNQILKGFFKSIISYINENENIDKQLIQLKTKEALLGILKENAAYLVVFDQFSQPELPDLATFMKHSYKLKVGLEELAKLSGRSLSTFNREFRRIFQASPHKWIMKQRLEEAKELLLSTPKTASQIYLDMGFEDLAHFSRSFKKAFGKTPTEIKNG